MNPWVENNLLSVFCLSFTCRGTRFGIPPLHLGISYAFFFFWIDQFCFISRKAIILLDFRHYFGFLVLLFSYSKKPLLPLFQIHTFQFYRFPQLLYLFLMLHLHRLQISRQSVVFFNQSLILFGSLINTSFKIGKELTDSIKRSIDKYIFLVYSEPALWATIWTNSLDESNTLSTISVLAPTHYSWSAVRGVECMRANEAIKGQFFLHPANNLTVAIFLLWGQYVLHRDLS